MDYYESFFNRVYCSLCQNPSPDYLYNQYFYHFSCLYNHYNNSLQNLNEIIPVSQLVNPNLCFLCENSEDIYSCPDCLKVFCVNCSANPAANFCCSTFKETLSKSLKRCPGCLLDKRSYHFVYDFKCSGHGYLCKKCFIFGAIRKKCIFGCEVKESWGIFINCKICKKNKFKNMAEYVCLNDCDICEICYYRGFVKGNNNCEICSSGLLKRD